MVSAVTDFAMVSVDVVREFQSTEQAEIRNQDYTLVRVPADGLVTESGSAPVGDVTAMVTLLDASRDPSAMPGGLVSVNAVTGALESIESFGAIDVTFMDETGEPLDLRPGQEAVVSIPLAEGKDLADALATMPLFYWSDDDGYWIRDGDASLEQVGSGQWAYTGRVSHFTTWIAALWYETIRIRGCVEDWEQNPVASAQVISTGLDYVGRSLAVTDSAGRFDIPAAGDSTVVLSAFGAAPGWWVGDVRMLHTDNDSMDLAQCLRIISVPPDDDEDDGDSDSDSSGVSQDMYDALQADFEQAVADRDAALAALAAAEAGRDTALAAQAEAEAAHAAAWEAQAVAEAMRDAALAALAEAEAERDTALAAQAEAEAAHAAALAALAVAQAERDTALAAQAEAEAAHAAALAALAVAQAERDTALAAQAEAEAADAAALAALAVAQAERDTALAAQAEAETAHATALAALAAAEAELDKVESVAQEALAGLKKAEEELAQCKARCP